MISLEVPSAPGHLFVTCALYSSNLPFHITAGTQNPEGTEVFCLPSLFLLLSSPHTAVKHTDSILAVLNPRKSLCWSQCPTKPNL